MRTLLSCCLIVLLSFGLVIHEASAKRFGGGRSFGVQRSQSSLFSSNKTQKTTPFAQKNKTSQWGGMLGGLVMGGLLASLFMGHGLTSGIFSWLILGSILFFAFSFLRKKMPIGANASNTHHFRQEPSSAANSPFTSWSNPSSHANPVSSFDAESFLRDAKVTFIRMQTAYDQKNLQDLAEFTAPEVFAEIKMQLAEQGHTLNTTEIIHLEAELLDVSKQSLSTIASVKFTGAIKENNEPVVNQLNEIWHFRQFDKASKWVIGGIQQEVYEL